MPDERPPSTLRVRTVAHPEAEPLDTGRQAPATALVIFGAAGDLTSRKLVPALFNLWRDGYLGQPFALIGVSRREKTDDAFRAELGEELRRHSRNQPASAEEWTRFAESLHYLAGDATDDGFYGRLGQRLEQLAADAGQPMRRVFYLAVAPELLRPAAEGLVKAGLTGRRGADEAARVVVEKPFGRDLESAQALNSELTDLLDERQIFRIDHYLGKETVQNILAFRFGNLIFEPLFNHRYVENVRITVAETVGMEGGRGGYYDATGALRDMVQNHLLQLLCLVAMEPPSTFEPESIHAEKIKVLRALPAFTPPQASRVVRGQYSGGELNGEAVPAYRDEEGVAADSNTETFVALEARIENWRWAGTPFLLRTGKQLAKRSTEIAVQFRKPPLRLFEAVGPEGDRCDIAQARPNQLVFRIQPDEGISLSFGSKVPGLKFQLQTVRMDYDYQGADQGSLPEAYERLLLDVMRGDSTLFMRSDEVECAWRFVDSVRAVWDQTSAPAFPNYAPGAWGPPEADQLFAGHGR